MFKINKNVLLFTTLLLTLPVLSSCDESSGSRNVSGRKKSITYLVSVESTIYKNILDQVIANFNQTIKDEGYEIVTESPGGSYYNSLGTKFSSNTAPDIFMMEIGYFNAYSSRMLPLDSYINESPNLSKDDLWYLNDYYQKDNQTLALIKDFSPDFMLIYNKTMLNQYNASHVDDQIVISETEPLTWLEFYEIASKIQASLNVQYGTSIGFEPIKHLHEWAQQTRATMYTKNDTELNVTDANVIEAFKFFAALQKDNAIEFPEYMSVNHNSGIAPGSYTSGSNMTEQELFKQGRAFSIFNGLYAFSAFDFYNTSFEVGIAPSPIQNKNDTPFSTTSAMVSHAINKYTRYPDLAYRFLEYYQTTGLQQFAGVGFNIPGNKTIANSDAFLVNENSKVSDMTQYFYDYVDQGYVHPTIYNKNISFSRVETSFNSHLAKYFGGQLQFEQLLVEINKTIKASV